MRYFIQHDPSNDWKKVHCPVLILNGDKDLQVNAAVNTQAIYGALPFHQQTEMIILSHHNHLFQYTENGGLSEYGTLEESLSLETIEAMADWLSKLP
jgi:pimeloyl-ACP methyl ester carboxylesterase